jgi:hypothetical protein
VDSWQPPARRSRTAKTCQPTTVSHKRLGNFSNCWMGNVGSSARQHRRTAAGILAGSHESRATVCGSLFAACLGLETRSSLGHSPGQGCGAGSSTPRFADGTKIERRLVGKFTSPTGLYSRELWDERKVRRLILHNRLAPRFPGAEFPVRVVVEDGVKRINMEGKGLCPEYIQHEMVSALEECPICFLYYPCLNTTLCCHRGICTECFLQLRPQRVVAHTTTSSCPFCKHELMEIVFHGARSEKEMDQLYEEESRVREAMEQARARQEAEAAERRLEVRRMRVEHCISTLRAVVAAAVHERFAQWLNFGGDSLHEASRPQSDADWRASLPEPPEDLQDFMNISTARKKICTSLRRTKSSPVITSRTGISDHIEHSYERQLALAQAHGWRGKDPLHNRTGTFKSEQPRGEPNSETQPATRNHSELQILPLETVPNQYTSSRRPSLSSPGVYASSSLNTLPDSSHAQDSEVLTQPMRRLAPDASPGQVAISTDPERWNYKRRRSARCVSVSSSAELLLTVNLMCHNTSESRATGRNRRNEQSDTCELPASAFLRRWTGSSRDLYFAWEQEELALLHDMEARGLLDWAEETDITYEELLLIEAIRRSLLGNT